MVPAATGSTVALDVGERRIGIAVASAVARLASPHGWIENNESVWEELDKVLHAAHASKIVVGLPRNLNGDDTAQTEYVRTFAHSLQQRVEAPIVFQDEALTSRRAEQELTERGRPYAKGDIDALAATYILEDYLNSGGVM